MASPPKTNQPAPTRPMPAGPPSAGGGTYRPLWFAMTAVAMMVLSLPTVVLLLFGMLPTIVAYIIDRTEQKYAAFCVGSMNFCGVFPFVLEVWVGDHTVSQSFQIMSDVFKLFIMYGAAGFGWMLHSGIPPLVSAMLVIRAQRRVEQLREIQQNLVREWGPEVSQPPPPPSAAPPPRRRRRQ